jgi:hypothetical protein
LHPKLGFCFVLFDVSDKKIQFDSGYHGRDYWPRSYASAEVGCIKTSISPLASERPLLGTAIDVHSIPSAPEQLLLELFVVFVTAKVLGEIFERLNLPAVPGEILAGMLLGPFALAWIPANDTLSSVAQMGVIFILFCAGLETRPSDLIRVSRKALVVSVLGVIAPFVLGFVYMKLRGDNSVEAVFVAAAMVATSIGITARVLGDMNVQNGRMLV